MSKQRLSKLQKWILRHCYYEEGGQVYKRMRKEDVFRFFKNTYFIGSQELVISRGFKGFMPLSEYNKAHATISRSLKGLRDKGLVKLVGKKRIEQPDYEGAMELASRYKTKEELQDAMKGMGVAEMIKMTNKFTEGEKVDIAVEIKGNDKANVKIVELTGLGVEKAKELLRLSP